MSERYLITNGVVIPSFSLTAGEAAVIPAGAVAWEGERIVAVSPAAEVQAGGTARVLDAHGGLILPGLINLHHHFYSALARGLDPGAPLRSFADVLDGLWWRLDRALDAESLRLSAQLSAADCIRWGCTTVFDHHASPSCLAGSLDILAAEIERAGISAVLCYEVTDRNGPEEARAGLEENLRFLEARRGDRRIRGMLGLHASFTLSDRTLEQAAARRPADAGCHVHVAEDALDIEASRRAFGRGPVERLERAGLLDTRALLAHGVHLSPQERERIAASGAVLIHNPESNANNRVGHLDVAGAVRQGCRVGLGTDGMSSAMLRALRFAYLVAQGNFPEGSAGAVRSLLECNAETARRVFDEPLLGKLAAGAPADLAVVDCAPATPVRPENLFAHLIFGASEAPVRHTVARGRILLEEFRHTTVDVEELAGRARRAAPALWERFRAQPRVTAYLGPGSSGKP